MLIGWEKEGWGRGERGRRADQSRLWGSKKIPPSEFFRKVRLQWEDVRGEGGSQRGVYKQALAVVEEVIGRKQPGLRGSCLRFCFVCCLLMAFVSLGNGVVLRSRGAAAKGRRTAVVKMGGKEETEEVVSKKQARRSIMGSDMFNRRGFKDEKEDASELMTSEFTSELLKEIRELENTLVRDDVTVRLAKSYGFCWGVERAVAIAYETRQHFPSKRIWLTNEIIHNPLVNKRYVISVTAMPYSLSFSHGRATMTMQIGGNGRDVPPTGKYGEGFLASERR